MAIASGGRASLLIGGRWQPSESGATFRATNPATGAVISEVGAGTRADAQAAIEAAAAAQPAWAALSAFERAAAMERVAAQIEARRDELANVLSLDQGKPLQAEATPRLRSSSSIGGWQPQTRPASRA